MVKTRSKRGGVTRAPAPRRAPPRRAPPPRAPAPATRAPAPRTAPPRAPASIQEDMLPEDAAPVQPPPFILPPPPVLPEQEFHPGLDNLVDVLCDKVMGKLVDRIQEAQFPAPAPAASASAGCPPPTPSTSAGCTPPTPTTSAGCSSTTTLTGAGCSSYTPTTSACATLPAATNAGCLLPPLSVQSILQPMPGSDAANLALRALLGESALSASPAVAPTRLSTPLGAHVSPSLKGKITSGQFVDLPLLLPQYSHLEDQSERKNPRAMPRLSFLEFTSAFHIFIAMRVEAHPQEAAGLLKHLETVQKLNSLYPEAWAFYDQNARLARHHAQQFNWGDIDTEIYMQAIAMGMQAAYVPPQAQGQRGPYQRPRQSSQSSAAGVQMRPNTCWAFQLHGKCDRPVCRFATSHACYLCQGPHATSSCPRDTSGQPFRGSSFRNPAPAQPFRAKRPGAKPQ